MPPETLPVFPTHLFAPAAAPTADVASRAGFDLSAAISRVIGEGERDSAMTAIVGHLAQRFARAGLPEDALQRFANQINADQCSPPLEAQVIDDKVERFYRKELEKQGPRSSGAIPLLGVTELLNQPDLAWLIEGLLPEQGLSVLWGEPNTGKSFLALDWALNIALGRAWHDRPVRQGAVVYVYAEGRVGLPQRLRAWLEVNTVSAPPAGVQFIPTGLDIADPATVDALLEAVRAALPESPVLVVIDTLARNMPGRNENQQQDMGAFLDGADRIKAAFGCNVLVIHHANKDGRARPTPCSL